MKRTERHHLKGNDLANLALGARQIAEERRGPILGIIAALVLIVLAGIGYSLWRGRVEERAGALLAEATALDEARVGPPPADGSPTTGQVFATQHGKYQTQLTKFKIVADDYPSTEAGIFARYREGATRMALGLPQEAATAFQQVIDRAGGKFYGQMARLGLAEAQSRSGQFDEAITIYTDLAGRTNDQLPIDGVLIQLARTYRDAGKRAEAEQTFNRIIAEFPGSPFSDEAKRELESLKPAA
jgi:tetratricopeptide (TPR) repeat protein